MLDRDNSRINLYRRRFLVSALALSVPFAIFRAVTPDAAIGTSTPISELTPTPTATKYAAKSHFIATDPNYCQNSINRYLRQSEAPETGCPTPTAFKTQPGTRSVANSHEDWGISLKDEAPASDATITPIPSPEAVVKPISASPTSTPTAFEDCGRFAGDIWQEECQKGQAQSQPKP